MSQETYNTKAIVLSRQSFKEVDSRVLLYSENFGLLNLVARGTKKNTSKLAAHIEPITETGVMIIKGRQYDYVGSSVSKNCFSEIKEDYEKIEIASSAIRKFKSIIKLEEIDVGLYELLIKYLIFLNEAELKEFQKDFYVNIFLIKLVALLGYEPNLNNAIADGEYYFDLEKGGLVSKKNIRRKSIYQISISIDEIETIRYIIKNSFSNINNKCVPISQSRGVNTIISFFIKYHIK